MYLYDIDEYLCINMSLILSVQIVRSKINFIARDITFTKDFKTKEKAREEYNRIKAMINEPPMIMTGDREKLKGMVLRSGNLG